MATKPRHHVVLRGTTPTSSTAIEKKEKKTEMKKRKKETETKQKKPTIDAMIVFVDAEAKALLNGWTKQIMDFCAIRDRVRAKWGSDLKVESQIKMGPGVCVVGYNPTHYARPYGYQDVGTDHVAAISLITKTRIALDRLYGVFVECIRALNDESKPPRLEFNFALRGATGLGAMTVETWDGYPVIVRSMIVEHQKAKRAYAAAYLKPDRLISVDLTAVGEHGTGSCVFSSLLDHVLHGGYMKQSTVSIIARMLAPMAKLAIGDDTDVSLLEALPSILKHYTP